MNKLIRLAIIVFLPCLLLGETIRKVTFRNSSGFTKDAVCLADSKEIAKESFDDTGKVTRTGSVPDGVVKEYSESKKIFANWNYKDNMLNGMSQFFFNTGEIMAEITFKNDDIESANIYSKTKELLVKIKGRTVDTIEFNIKGEAYIPSTWICYLITSAESPFLQGAELDVQRKAAFITSSLGRIYGIKDDLVTELKTASSSGDFNIVTKTATQRNVKSQMETYQKNYYVVSKLFLVQGLGAKKSDEVQEMVGKILSYGAIKAKDYSITPQEMSNVLQLYKGGSQASLDEVLAFSWWRNFFSNDPYGMYMSYNTSRGSSGLASSFRYSSDFGQQQIIAILKFKALQQAKDKIKVVIEVLKALSIKYTDVKFDYNEVLGEFDENKHETKYIVTIDKNRVEVSYTPPSSPPPPVAEKPPAKVIDVKITKCVYADFILKEKTLEKIPPAEGAKYVTLYLEVVNASKKELRNLRADWKLIDSKDYEHSPVVEEKNLVNSKIPLQPESSVKTKLIFQMNKDCLGKELIGTTYPKSEVRCKIE